jgi:branched-chain amino acid transport system substrate-binding protein
MSITIFKIEDAPNGDLRLTVTIKDNNGTNERSYACILPPFPEDLKKTIESEEREYRLWLRYQNDPPALNPSDFSESSGIPTLEFGLPPGEDIETNPPIDRFSSCQIHGRNKITQFNKWINARTSTIPSGQQINSLRGHLLENLPVNEYRSNPNDYSFIVQTNTNDRYLNLLLQKLPFHEWDFLEDRYPDAEFTFSMEVHPALPPQNNLHRVFVIIYDDGDLGTDRCLLNAHLQEIHNSFHNSQNFNITYWSGYRGRLNNDRLDNISSITQLPNISHPEQDLYRELNANLPTILIFVGHSRSIHSPENFSQICLNSQVHLSPEHRIFKRVLRDLRDQGLIFAAFFSCDGLNIARSFNQLKIPYILVSRDLLPIHVALDSIREFLQEAKKPGVSINVALNRVRKYLQQNVETRHTNEGCPNASNLLALFHHPSQPAYILNPVRDAEIITGPKGTSVPPLTKLTFLERLNKIRDKIKSLIPSRFVRLLLPGILALLTVFALDLFFKDPLVDRISSGERILITGTTSSDKIKGKEFFAKHDYNNAATSFQASLKTEPNDPEALIYLQNSIARSGSKQPFKIAAVVPIGSQTKATKAVVCTQTKETPIPKEKRHVGATEVAKEMLRGIAQAQKEANGNGGIGGAYLEVEILNDDNDCELAKEIANRLTKDSDIRAVAGHNASHVSLEAIPDYQKAGLVMITPTSTDDNLSGKGDHIFRTAPRTSDLTQTLAEQIYTVDRHRKLLLCYDSSAPDTTGFKQQLIDKFVHLGGEIDHSDCNVTDESFDSKKIDLAVKNKVDAIFVAAHINYLDSAKKVVSANQRKLPLYSSPTLNTKQTLEWGNDVEGLKLVTPWLNPLVTTRGSFSDRAQKLWGAQVSWRTAMSFDAVKAIVAGLQQSDHSRSGLKQQLHAKSFSTSGSAGAVKFLKTGDRDIVPMIAEIKKDVNGQLYFAPLPQPTTTGR